LDPGGTPVLPCVAEIWKAAFASLYDFIDNRVPDVTNALAEYHRILPALEAVYNLVDTVTAGKALGKLSYYIP
jgi:hypothetical protein